VANELSRYWPISGRQAAFSPKGRRLAAIAVAAWLTSAITGQTYFPPPDSDGGWRTPASPVETRRVAGIDIAALDKAFDLIQRSTPNGGLLVVRRGWLVYERYFGRGHREATPNLASCGKSFTSIAVGILMAERPDLFPHGLDTKVFTAAHFPPEAFPMSDPRKAAIKLGQLLAMTAGIRGNNPGLARGAPVTLEPEGPDGAPAMRDAMALGREPGERNAITLWTEPGAGYSYATSSVHLASILLRHVSGLELEDFVRVRLATPLRWSRWTFGYRQANLGHTPGGGGIAMRGTDVLRFLYLLLHEGKWSGRQIVPGDYVRQCGRSSPYNPHSPYSLQFDVNSDGHVRDVPREAFWKSGSGGHAMYVVPPLDLVAFKLGGRDGQYATSDHGLPEAPSSTPNRYIRDGRWAASIEAREALDETLRQIVRATK
jgi:CubicO group peptidase (beta-lactamase class C family)